MVPWLGKLAIKLGISINKNDSSSQNQRASVKGTGNEINQTTTNNYSQTASEPLPEISLQLNAQANSGAFTGIVSNKSGRQLVLTGVEIGGVRTEFSQQFNISCPLENLKFPAEVFDKPTSEIPVKVTYRTLDDKNYELTITGVQQHRADERYNVIFPGPSAIKPRSD